MQKFTTMWIKYYKLSNDQFWSTMDGQQRWSCLSVHLLVLKYGWLTTRNVGKVVVGISSTLRNSLLFSWLIFLINLNGELQLGRRLGHRPNGFHVNLCLFMLHASLILLVIFYIYIYIYSIIKLVNKIKFEITFLFFFLNWTLFSNVTWNIFKGILRWLN